MNQEDHAFNQQQHKDTEDDWMYGQFSNQYSSEEDCKEASEQILEEVIRAGDINFACKLIWILDRSFTQKEMLTLYSAQIRYFSEFANQKDILQNMEREYCFGHLAKRLFKHLNGNQFTNLLRHYVDTGRYRHANYLAVCLERDLTRKEIITINKVDIARKKPRYGKTLTNMVLCLDT